MQKGAFETLFLKFSVLHIRTRLMKVYGDVYILAEPSDMPTIPTMPTEGIIGAAVGGLVLMVLVVILAVFIMR